MSGPLHVAAERMLERALRGSVSAEQRLEALEGRSFRIRVDGLPIDAVLLAERGKLRVLDGGERSADVTVRGTPLDLLRLAGRRNIASGVHGSGVELRGRVHVAEQFAELFRLAFPDLEEALSGWIGDIPAHHAGNAGRAAVGWLAKAARALRLDTAEYLTEESRLLPTRYEADALLADVDRLRDDVERAAARLERVERLLRGARGAEAR